MRFPVEIVQAIRGQLTLISILFRIAVKHHFEGGRTIEETLPMLNTQDALMPLIRQRQL